MSTRQQFLRYLFSGSIAVAIHLSVLVTAVEWFLVPHLLATSLGFIMGSIFNYCLQYYWIFKSNGSHGARFLKYFLFATMMLGVNAQLFSFFMNSGMDYRLSQGLATVIVFVLNFLINKFLTFRPA